MDWYSNNNIVIIVYAIIAKIVMHTIEDMDVSKY